MSNDWLRPVQVTADTGDADDRLAALRAKTSRLAASTLYPQFLDAGIPPVEDVDED